MMNNTKRELIELVQRLLNQLGFHSSLRLSRKGNTKWKDLYEAYMWRNGEMLDFMNFVRPSIKNFEDWIGKSKLVFKKWLNRPPPKNRPKFNDQQLSQLLEEGFRDKEIAARFGAHPRTVQEHRLKLGWSMR